MDRAVAIAQALFHAEGYDAVGVAALTEAFGINPPSFYAAFRSKGALFERVMDRYAAEGLRFETFATPDLAPGQILYAYLAAAAELYAADPREAGCLVFEAARGVGVAQVTAAARRRKEACRQAIRSFVAKTHPATAEAVADTVIAVMSGLSAGAREGWDATRLLAIANLAAAGVAAALR